jgi:hypothetical protein
MTDHCCYQVLVAPFIIYTIKIKDKPEWVRTRFEPSDNVDLLNRNVNENGNNDRLMTCTYTLSCLLE